jgi:hypothetical protein
MMVRSYFPYSLKEAQTGLHSIVNIKLEIGVLFIIWCANL